MSSSRAAGPVANGGEVDDDGDVLVTTPGVSPHVLIDPYDGHAVEAMFVVDHDALAFGQDGVVGGVPGDPEPFGDPGDGQVLAHDPFQRPPQPTPRELGPRLRGQGGVLAPHTPAAGAPVAAHGHFQHRGSPAQRLVGQSPHHAVTRGSLAAAAAAPPIGLHNPAGQDRPVGLEALPDNLEAELVESAERSQVRAGEARTRGSVRHVEVFQMGGVGTSIFGRPRPLPGHRRADHGQRRHTPATPWIVKSPFAQSHQASNPPAPALRNLRRSGRPAPWTTTSGLGMGA
jgi:hypothetical protein